MSLEKLDKLNRALASEVIYLASKRGVTIGCAESCTGGLIAGTLTSVPGSSDAFVGGVVSYWIAVKEAVLGVPAETIDAYGVVSAEVARAMADGAARTLSCDYAVSTTGIAGPGGAEPGKPVGTVWFGLHTPAGTTTLLNTSGGSRDEVRLTAVRQALTLLRDGLAD